MTRKDIVVLIGLPGIWAVFQWLEFAPTIYIRLLFLCFLLIAVFGWLVRVNPGEWVGTIKKPVFSDFVLGAGTGVLAILGTLAGISFFETFLPALTQHIESIYAQNGLSEPLIELPAVVLVVVAEEVIWREITPRILSKSRTPFKGFVLSVLAYTVAQVGTGSLAVVFVAAVLGTLWMFLKTYTGSLFCPLVSHLFWTCFVLLSPIV